MMGVLDPEPQEKLFRGGNELKRAYQELRWQMQAQVDSNWEFSKDNTDLRDQLENSLAAIPIQNQTLDDLANSQFITETDFEMHWLQERFHETEKEWNRILDANFRLKRGNKHITYVKGKMEDLVGNKIQLLESKTRI